MSLNSISRQILHFHLQLYDPGLLSCCRSRDFNVNILVVDCKLHNFWCLESDCLGIWTPRARTGPSLQLTSHTYFLPTLEEKSDPNFQTYRFYFIIAQFILENLVHLFFSIKKCVRMKSWILINQIHIYVNKQK